MNDDTSRQTLTVAAMDAAQAEYAGLARIIGHPALNRLLGACLQDLLGSVIRLSGVSFTVAASGPKRGDDIRGLVPAGVNLVAPSSDMDESTLVRFLLGNPASAAAGRNVVVMGDALSVPASTVGTAFGVLERADLVVGPSRNSAWYLVGVGAETATAVVLEAGSRTAALLGEAERRGLVARRVEPRPRLADVSSFEALSGLRRSTDLGPHVAAWLAERFSTP